MRQTLIHLSIAFMVVGLFLFAACGPDEPEEEVLPRIEVEPAELLFTSDGGTESIALSANCSWSIDVPSDSFLTLSPTSGQGNTTVRVLVPPSDDVEARGVMFHINGVIGILLYTVVWRLGGFHLGPGSCISFKTGVWGCITGTVRQTTVYNKMPITPLM